MPHFELASADIAYGEAARYYHAYSAYREKENALAFKLWRDIALTGGEFPQRAVQRLTALAGRGMKMDVLGVFRKVSETREYYPDLAADALVGLARLGDAATADAARKLLYEKFAATNQAASARWESGWKKWKEKNYDGAYKEWADGFSREIKNRELASRLLYWQSRALFEIGSPVAAERVKRDLTEWYPAEYHTFLANPRGGVISADAPVSYDMHGALEDWGFVTYARLESEMTPQKPGETDIPGLYRAVRLALWEGDYSSAARNFSTLLRAIPANEYAASAVLRCHFPKAFEKEVMEAHRKTGI